MAYKPRILATSEGGTGTATICAFMAFNPAIATNATGDGTAFFLGDTDVGSALTEVFDIGNNLTNGASGGALFTAPVTGQYLLGYNVLFTGMVAGTNTSNQIIITSNANYTLGNYTNVLTGNNNFGKTILVDMDVGDTAKIQLGAGGGTKIVSIFGGASDRRTNFWGYLVHAT